MSIEEIPIKYQERDTTILKYREYDELINQICYKFYIPKKYKKQIRLSYLDEDGDFNDLEEKDYSSNYSDIQSLILKIEEESQEQLNNDDKKQEILEKSEKLKKDIEQYKIKLKESCLGIIKKEIKELNEKHENELNKLKNYYEKKKERIKNEISKAKLEEFDSKSSEFIESKLKEYMESIHKEINDKVIAKKESWIKLMEQIEKDFEDFEKKQNDIEKTIGQKQKEIEKASKK